MKRSSRYDVAIIGHFGFGDELLNGQTIKTKIVSAELEKQLGSDHVKKVDTHGGISAYMKLPFQMLSALRMSKNVVILPAHNGIRIIAPLLKKMNFFFGCGLHYIVIGGWLPKLLTKKRWLRKQLSCFQGIYVETWTMKKKLEDQGLHNILIMPNCKDLTVLKPEELVYHTDEPFKLCTFSRINAEKGIETAVSAVKMVNEQSGRTVFVLDIYGSVDAGQERWFEELRNTFPEYVHYRGAVAFSESTDVLKDYFALLFPTRYYTEGIPGTIIDAYAAGVPVVCSKWESCADVVDNRVSGYCYDFNAENGLSSILFMLRDYPEKANELKSACLLKAKNYVPFEAIRVFLNNTSNIKTCGELTDSDDKHKIG